jgi:uncharacterized membrane protein
MNSTLGTPKPAIPFPAATAPSAPLRPSEQPALALAAIGLLGLGILSLVYGDFALVWQPVAPWIPGRTGLAYLTGVLESITAIGLLIPSTTAWAVRVLGPGVILWQLLKLPELFGAPANEGSYLGFGELAILAAGGVTLFVRLSRLPAGSRFAFLASPRALQIARRYFGLWIIPIGISHFVFHDATVHLIPSWIPDRSFFAYLTGAGQIASGLGVLFNVLARVAAYAEAIQIFIYTALIWIPAVVHPNNPDIAAVFGSPDPHIVWTALFVSWLFASCALAVAQNVPSKS